MSTIVRLRPRLSIAAAAAAVAFLLLPAAWPLTARILAAWDIAAFTYLGMSWTMLARSGMESMRERAQLEEAGALVILGCTVAVAIASLAAIAAELAGIRAGQQAGVVVRLVFAGITILGSWAFLHTVFAIHYAHEYYRGSGDPGGLLFPDEPEPDYWDFMYFAFTIGAASQTSDVAVESRLIRRVVLAHTIVSFLFNTTILGMVVNVGAGLL